MNPQQQQLKNSKQNPRLPLAVAFLVIGFVVGVAASMTLFPKLPFVSSNTVIKPAGTSLFTSQNATVEGKVTKVKGNVISVENTKGVKGDVELSKNVMISKNTNQGIATPSSDLKNIELNKTAFISLTTNPETGNLEVNMITYMATAPGTGGTIAPPPLPKGTPPPPPSTKTQPASGSAARP